MELRFHYALARPARARRPVREGAMKRVSRLHAQCALDANGAGRDPESGERARCSNPCWHGWCLSARPTTLDVGSYTGRLLPFPVTVLVKRAHYCNWRDKNGGASLLTTLGRLVSLNLAVEEARRKVRDAGGLASGKDFLSFLFCQ